MVGVESGVDEDVASSTFLMFSFSAMSTALSNLWISSILMLLLLLEGRGEVCEDKGKEAVGGKAYLAFSSSAPRWYLQLTFLRATEVRSRCIAAGLLAVAAPGVDVRSCIEHGYSRSSTRSAWDWAQARHDRFDTAECLEACAFGD